jgi:hypothetical protein
MNEQKFEQKIERVASPEAALDNRAWESVSVAQELPQVAGPVSPNLVTEALPNNVMSSDLYKDAQLLAIEKVLEQDLEQIYFDLPEESKSVFKKEGELTARKINALLSETKVAAQKIVDLVLAWLSLVPGVNRFFAEQEAKIKADKILAMKNYAG